MPLPSASTPPLSSKSEMPSLSLSLSRKSGTPSPSKSGLKPGVLVCHGGGGYADMVAGAVIGWAKRGYVSVCQDQPGIGNRSKFRSSGPCCRPGASSFKIVSRPEDSALFDGVVAALNGLRLPVGK